jgi:CelD/BcsL family acetyltransferase involved in cellulose biosynthesis
VRPKRGHPYLPLDKSWLEPESHLNSGRRSDFRRAKRNAEKVGTLRCEMIIPTREELPGLLDEAFQVEAANWKGAQGSALATDPLVGGFYRRYAEETCDRGQLRLGFLRLGGRAVAMQFAVEHAGHFWLLKMGFDQEVARCAPGQLLMIESLRFAASQKCEVYEILGSSEPWNQVWTQLVHPAVSLRIYRSGVRGAIDAAVDFTRARLARKS